MLFSYFQCPMVEKMVEQSFLSLELQGIYSEKYWDKVKEL